MQLREDEAVGSDDDPRGTAGVPFRSRTRSLGRAYYPDNGRLHFPDDFNALGFHSLKFGSLRRRGGLGVSGFVRGGGRRRFLLSSRLSPPAPPHNHTHLP